MGKSNSVNIDYFSPKMYSTTSFIGQYSNHNYICISGANIYATYHNEARQLMTSTLFTEKKIMGMLNFSFHAVFFLGEKEIYPKVI